MGTQGKRILLCGCGMVAPPLIRYLLEWGAELTIASNDVERARTLLAGNRNGKAIDWHADDQASLETWVGEHDLVISLLPAPLHARVATACVAAGRHLVTTSYVSDEMAALDEGAKARGILLLNELGVDPGIDHMSALEMIHQARANGKEVVSFRSYCGGLPAPESNNNPWGYKFSWSPLAVLRATSASAEYLANGQRVVLDGNQVFEDIDHFDVDGVGRLETYPNRDATAYIERYGLETAQTMYRGTLRYPGWAETVIALKALDLLSPKPTTHTAWNRLLSARLSITSETADNTETDTSSLLRALAMFLGVEEDSALVSRLAWLGLTNNEPITGGDSSIMEALAALMQKRLGYGPEEQDMIVMRHELKTRRGNETETLRAELLVKGEKGGDSAMAKTVGLPAAIAATLVLDGKIVGAGVQIPITPSIYQPILQELANCGISLNENIVP
jgi:saccharopine dehydrogenase (NADP+, L-glutamate forming)